MGALKLPKIKYIKEFNMIKSIVVGEVKKLEFPKLMIRKDSDLIVLMVDEGQGVVVWV
jgi:hypothetical protein